MEESPRVTLRPLAHRLAVVRLPAGAPIPRWAARSRWFSITRTADELSIVCLQSAAPKGALCERDFRAIAVAGPLDFGLTGILASLASPLAAAKISMFAISTFDTDYVLVRGASLPAALQALRAAGHTIVER
jgi:hypothetical protein